ncbi:hypothetical protein SELR_18620 [Selenomonas ruminantium subsp. lactilytica TAM6421]|uniref:TadE-like domain-containing protein n=1 Tax=Selenomonas ruminantium subsp. lactilytica (strain NBRC 103574 / TAM6421) TaxID=927704 RepID=I0GS33_SELRL|nr:TadE/TadG family type IV pilus assembly protein [Selenomonas ruminantium]BAL83570.1 hypothetical protein SELR_18620 [Selenomonas ruminantium subsp. lactilytica TAM6421]
MKFQRGQAIVEFALLLPLFLVLLFGIFYSGMVMADYLTLSSIARSSAREAAIVDNKNKYKTIRDNYVKKSKLPIDILDWNPKKNENDFKITYEKNSQNVIVELKADLNKDGVGYTLAGVLDNITGSDMKDISLKIRYTMYSEKQLE